MIFRRSITSVRETVKLNPRGQLERWVVVEYFLNDLGPFVVEVPKSQFTWDLVKEEMARQEQGIREVTGGEQGS